MCTKIQGLLVVDVSLVKHWMGGPFSAPDHVHLTAGITAPFPTVGEVGGGVTP